MSKSKNEDQTKKPGMFEPGGPGGPGRREGSRNKATLVLDQIADGAGEEILRTMVEAAKGGDMRAAELILSRIWPVRKGRPVSLDLPSIQTAADLNAPRHHHGHDGSKCWRSGRRRGYCSLMGTARRTVLPGTPGHSVNTPSKMYGMTMFRLLVLPALIPVAS
jgi:hypothetical protein